jgi:glutamate--cysteine ligase regulatory subunit
MGGSPSTLGSFTNKSNAELTASLRSNFSAHNRRPARDHSSPSRPWTSRSPDGGDLYIPSLRPTKGLREPRLAYDITLKLFFLPDVPASQRCQHTRDALEFVMRELGVDYVDLLIVSFPGITFDADDESDESDVTNNFSESAASDDYDDFEPIITTWHTLETLQERGVVRKLGLAEFGTQRLSRLLAAARLPPAVDQINVRDCCVVPRPLIVYAKDKHIELLTHNDCTDILPSGTVRELLGPGENGARILASSGQGQGEGGEEGLKGEVMPLWVVKYTAVVQDRGVVEDKGYFAAAELQS